MNCRHFLSVLALLGFLNTGTAQESLRERLLEGLGKWQKFDFCIIGGHSESIAYGQNERGGTEDKSTTEFTAHLALHPDGLLKLDFHPQTGPWVGGPSSTYENYSRISYNGRYWMRAEDKIGKAGESDTYARATITESRPESLSKEVGEAGFPYLVPVLKVFREKGLIQALESGADLKIEEEGGLIKVTFSSEAGKSHNTDCLWFDPGKGMAMVKRIATHGQLEEVWTIVGCREQEGIWLPTNGESYAKIGETMIAKSAIEFSSFEFQQSLPEGTFDLPLKAGYIVEDKRNNLTFTTGTSSQTIEETIRNLNRAKPPGEP